ncbi:MAG: hypothetical protein HY711_00845 [Candidatus Melainabacteria bacterium]|nr:hypothetical protein [Candidatus Melainabacteria bacterium]
MTKSPTRTWLDTVRFCVSAILLLLSVFSLLTWQSLAAPEPAARHTKQTPSLPKYIGIATMDKDGTITLQLRAEGPGNAIGDALLVYPKTHPEYKSILKHIGSLRPGEIKPVRPWPDKKTK